MGETPEDLPLHEEQAHREAGFVQRIVRANAKSRDLPLRCPCCGCKTLEERAMYEICEVCFWEDDGQDGFNVDKCRGGPNGRLSLRQARINYLQFSACEESMISNVRPPRPEE